MVRPRHNTSQLLPVPNAIPDRRNASKIETIGNYWKCHRPQICRDTVCFWQILSSWNLQQWLWKSWICLGLLRSNYQTNIWNAVNPRRCKHVETHDKINLGQGVCFPVGAGGARKAPPKEHELPGVSQSIPISGLRGLPFSGFGGMLGQGCLRALFLKTISAPPPLK